MNILSYIIIAACTCIMEIGWISAVRWVSSNSMLHIVLIAVTMQAISNASTLILVNNHFTMFASIIGAGLGAFIGMKIPNIWFQKEDDDIN